MDCWNLISSFSRPALVVLVLDFGLWLKKKKKNVVNINTMLKA